MKFEKYFSEDGKYVAVLVTCNYGAGWSTWNDTEYERGLAMDKRIIQLFMLNPDISKERLVDILDSFGYHDIYTGGWKNLKIFWIDVGSIFRITEYDGCEGIETFYLADWFKA